MSISPVLSQHLNSQANAANPSSSQTPIQASHTPKANDVPKDTFIKRNGKKIALGAGVVSIAALVCTAAFALKRGKAVNEFYGSDTKLLSNLKTGFKLYLAKEK